MGLREAVGRAPYQVVFVCADGGPRAVAAHAILTRLSSQARSDRTAVRPLFVSRPARLGAAPALDGRLCAMLERLGYPPADVPPPWAKVAATVGPELDFVFLLCAGSALPEERHAPTDGRPTVVCWRGPDIPLDATGQLVQAQLWADLFGRLHNRLLNFVNLPFDSLDRLALNARVHALDLPTVRGL
jgi:hypothetical protein